MISFLRKGKKEKWNMCVCVCVCVCVCWKDLERSLEECTQVLALATLLALGCKEEMVILYSGLYCLTHYNDSKTQAATLCN